MAPFTYHCLSKLVRVMRGRTEMGRIVYRSAYAGWCWAPRNSTFRTPSRLTWSDVIPDVEAWYETEASNGTI